MRAALYISKETATQIAIVQVLLLQVAMLKHMRKTSHHVSEVQSCRGVNEALFVCIRKPAKCSIILCIDYGAYL